MKKQKNQTKQKHFCIVRMKTDKGFYYKKMLLDDYIIKFASLFRIIEEEVNYDLISFICIFISYRVSKNLYIYDFDRFIKIYQKLKKINNINEILYKYRDKEYFIKKRQTIIINEIIDKIKLNQAIYNILNNES